MTGCKLGIGVDWSKQNLDPSSRSDDREPVWYCAAAASEQEATPLIQYIIQPLTLTLTNVCEANILSPSP